MRIYRKAIGLEQIVEADSPTFLKKYGLQTVIESRSKLRKTPRYETMLLKDIVLDLLGNTMAIKNQIVASLGLMISVIS